MVKVRRRLGVGGCSSVVSKTAAVKRARVSARARGVAVGWSRCVHEREHFGASGLSQERGLRCSSLLNVAVHLGADPVGATLTTFGQSTGMQAGSSQLTSRRQNVTVRGRVACFSVTLARARSPVDEAWLRLHGDSAR